MNYLITILLLVITHNLFAKAIVFESFYIGNPSQELFELLKSRPELTIDHKTRDGLELYGPKGLQDFLIKNRINYDLISRDTIDQNLKEYPTPLAIETKLKSLNKAYPILTELYSIGKSVKGRDLWVMKLSKNLKKFNDPRPAFKYIANMHGDEIVGRELMVILIEDLLKNYHLNPTIKKLLDDYQIHILVSMNPDGAANGTRGNANYVDLNRDFPTINDNADDPSGREPETQAVMKWQKEHHFKLSANFHGGAEVINYPWDSISTRHPKDELVKLLSLNYAGRAPYIGASTSFENGITNGYDWYQVIGGMQDWSSFWHNDLQITIELSDDKWPAYQTIDYYYKENREALIQYIHEISSI